MNSKRKSNVVLIGMSGAGKSTLGVLLAKSLGKSFLDTDLLIQQKEGMLLQQILDLRGSEFFLALEEEVIASLEAENCVIATGGSVVYSQKAMHALQKNATVVYLDVDYEEIAKRLSNITTRGIVFKGSSTLRSVYEERLPLYQKYADLTLQCPHANIEASVEQIVKALR